MKKRTGLAPSKLEGFTLLEILIVASIIMLLAVASVVSYTSLNRSSRDARRKSDLEQMRAAFEQWRSDYGSYPVTSINCNSSGGLISGSNTYLQSIPKDPQCPTRSYYSAVSVADYTLGAGLEGVTSACSGLSATSCGTAACSYCVGPYGVKP